MKVTPCNENTIISGDKLFSQPEGIYQGTNSKVKLILIKSSNNGKTVILGLTEEGEVYPAWTDKDQPSADFRYKALPHLKLCLEIK